MKILIVSDSHGRCCNLEIAIARVRPIDMLIHLGDIEGDENYILQIAGCPVEMVAGNNDFFTGLPREKLIQIEKYKILLTHGHWYGVNYGTGEIKKSAKMNAADIVMFGHTHQPIIDQSDDTIWAVNPGSITQPRQQGRIPTFMIMDLDRRGAAHFTVNYLK